MFGLFFLLTAAIAADPQFTKLEKGEPAPWSGRLFNDEAVAKFIVDDKYKVEQCNIQIEYEVSKSNLNLSLDHQKQMIELQTKNQILSDKITLRNDRIKELENLKTPPNPFWYTLGGILVGSGVTIGITYAVNQ
tara:strand:+ start:116 stop:517 length:402 start_codon:yes stop_codon:yes gene_type:complete